MKFGSQEGSPITKMLERVPIFSGLTQKELRSIASSSKEKKFQAGQTMVSEGESGVGFFLIIEGRAEVRRGGNLLSRLEQGQFFGEMTLLDEQPRSADVVAVEPTRCLIFTVWDFHGMIRTYPKMAREIMKEMARRLRLTNKAFS
ncbi:MAG: cyclic nucleotide-binding domain-containing protein [Thaumarchaeota archaeon]|nr:cyclic nucleotide-binding domain-containing protein [Nitrososphaerota archaeon]MBI3022821.1 cyclic nucleotide-binding domain-containing protein [Nitrososphaerota archaeon]MCS4539486.1 cyclic nucleotide-binding domain-containing protein [Nitrososphaerota archaeon]